MEATVNMKTVMNHEERHAAWLRQLDEQAARERDIVTVLVVVLAEDFTLASAE